MMQTKSRICAALGVMAAIGVAYFPASAIQRGFQAGAAERAATIRKTAVTVAWRVAKIQPDHHQNPRKIQLKLENPEYDDRPEMRIGTIFVTVAKGDPAFVHANRLREKDITRLKPGNIRRTAQFLTPFDGPLAVTFQEAPGHATNH